MFGIVKKAKSQLFTASIFFASVVVWFWDEIANGFLFCFLDINKYFYPYRLFLVQSIKSGILPLWNPFIYMGYPFLATFQTGLFYPITLIYFFLPFDIAFNLYIILHCFMALVFMYVFLRDIKLGVSASVFGAFCFAFSGYLNSILHMLSSLSSFVWLPLLAMYLRRLFYHSNMASGKLFNFSISVFLFTAMLLGGEPSIFAWTSFFVFLYILIENVIYKRDIVGFIKNIAAFFAVLFFALMLSAVTLLPFLELVQYSIRSHGLSFFEASYWSFSFPRLITLAIPYFFNLSSMAFVNTEWVKNPYLGIIPIMFALFAGLLLIKKKNMQLLLLGLFASIILALGKFTPLYLLLFNTVPFFSLNRYPVKVLFMATFLCSVLAALGFDAMLSFDEAQNKTKTRILLWSSALGAGLFAAAIFFSYKIQLFADLCRSLFVVEIKQFIPKGLYLAIAARNISNIEILGVMIIFICALLLFAINKRITKWAAITGIIILLFFDLFTANRNTLLAIKSSDYHKESKNIKMLISDKDLFRVFTSPGMETRYMYEYESEFKDYPKTLLSIRDRITPNQNMIYKISHVLAYESIKSNDQEELIAKINKLDSLDGIKILNLMNVKYLVSPYRLKLEGYSLISITKEAARKGEIYIYENNNVLPRAMVIPKCKVLGKDEMLKFIVSSKFNPKKEILVEKLISAETGRYSPASIGSYGINQVRIKARGPGFLLLSDYYYPGWKVFVDGREKCLIKADYLFRAVQIGEGEHNIEFAYRPLSFIIGLGLSCITFVFLVGIIIYSRTLKR